MTQYFTDFSEYTTGQQPSDWTKRFAATYVWTVADDGAALGGKVLSVANNATATRNGLSWDAIDADAARADSETFVKFRFLSGTDATEVMSMVRGSGLAGDETIYRYGARSNTDALQIARYLNGAFLEDTATPWSPVANTWYNLLSSTIGDQHKLKVWPASDPEPTLWDLETTNTEITAAGWIGLFKLRGGAVDIDVFSVGTSGDSALRAGSGAYPYAMTSHGTAHPNSVTASANFNTTGTVNIGVVTDFDPAKVVFDWQAFSDQQLWRDDVDTLAAVTVNSSVDTTDTCRLRWETDTASGEYDVTVSISEAAVVISPPTNLSVTNLLTTSATLSWVQGV